MPVQLIDKGAGWFVVMDGDQKVAGPSRDKAAMQGLAAAYVSPPSSDEARRKEYERKLDAQFRAERTAITDKIHAVLVEAYDEDTATRMMRDIAPIVALGREGRRRERIAFARVPPKTAAAAA